MWMSPFWNRGPRLSWPSGSSRALRSRSNTPLGNARQSNRIYFIPGPLHVTNTLKPHDAKCARLTPVK